MDRSEISYQVNNAAGDVNWSCDTFNALLNGLDNEMSSCVDAGVSAASLSDFTRVYMEGLSFVLCHFRTIVTNMEALAEEISPSKEVKESMDEAHTKAQATRERNLAAQTARIEEQTKAKEAARLALQRVTENPDATPGELLEAARLLAELTR